MNDAQVALLAASQQWHGEISGPMSTAARDLDNTEKTLRAAAEYLHWLRENGAET
jgi:hypothetical protein